GMRRITIHPRHRSGDRAQLVTLELATVSLIAAPDGSRQRALRWEPVKAWVPIPVGDAATLDEYIQGLHREGRLTPGVRAAWWRRLRAWRCSRAAWAHC